jgi:p-aminobenzoyl-glutamate transporter AbgT
MLHSVPEAEIKELTKAMRQKAEYLFITSAAAKFYESFSESSWGDFIASMGEE